MKSKRFTKLIFTFMLATLLTGCFGELSAVDQSRAAAQKEEARAFVSASKYYCASQLFAKPSVVIKGVKTNPGADEVGIADISNVGTDPDSVDINFAVDCEPSGTLKYGKTVYKVSDLITK